MANQNNGGEKKSVIGRIGSAFGKLNNQFRGEETVAPQQFNDLPPGIKNGVARLETCHIVKIGEGKKNAGKPLFYADAIVVEPTEVVVREKGREPHVVRVEGGRTKVMITLADVTTSGGKVIPVAESFGKMYNLLRLIGGDDFTADIETEEQLHQKLQALVDAETYIGFETWASQPTPQYPNPQTNHKWLGAVADYSQATGGGVEDNTEHADHEGAGGASVPNRKGAKAAQTNGAAGKGTKTARGAKAAPETPEPAAFDDGAVDLDALAEAAEGGDEDAAYKLTELAADRGVSRARVARAKSWEEVAGWVRDAGGEEEEPGEPEETEGEEGEYDEPAAPEKGEVWAYRPLGPDKKTRLKPVDVEVLEVSGDTATVVDLKDRKKKYKVNVAVLEPAN